MNGFKQRHILSPYIGKGANGAVYAISDSLVAKVDHDDREFHLERELEKSLDMFNQGISTPKPEGVFIVRIMWPGLNTVCFRARPALVMQRIRGYRGEKVPPIHIHTAQSLLNQELELCIRRGFYWYHHDKNWVYNPSENRVYLVDADDWHR